MLFNLIAELVEEPIFEQREDQQILPRQHRYMRHNASACVQRARPAGHLVYPYLGK